MISMPSKKYAYEKRKCPLVSLRKKKEETISGKEGKKKRVIGAPESWNRGSLRVLGRVAFWAW